MRMKLERKKKEEKNKKNIKVILKIFLLESCGSHGLVIRKMVH